VSSDAAGVSVAEHLSRVGGVATRAALVAATSRTEVQGAISSGAIVGVARGRYALPDADTAMVAAIRLCGVVSHTSAALQHGWSVGAAPVRPHVTVAKNRLLTKEQRAGVELHRTSLGPDDVTGLVTSRERTLLDCLRGASVADGLAVADSALRDGFSPSTLRALARDARGPGSRQVRWIAERADGRAANGFESSLRAIALTVPGLHVVPQLSIREPAFLGRPDLVDAELGIIVEADSFEWHGNREALSRDARRYNQFVVHGWLVLRFTWEDVMFHPAEVRVILTAAVAERTERRCRCSRSA
jgi:very-short-patch-repair endonuclease